MGQAKSKPSAVTSNNNIPRHVIHLIDRILAQIPEIFKDHATCFVEDRKLDEIGKSVNIDELEYLLWQHYADKSVARALISFSAFKSLKSLQNKLEKEEKLKIIREIIRLTALDTGIVDTYGKWRPPDRKVTVRLIVWYQALSSGMFDNEQELLNLFFKTMHRQLVRNITLEELLAQDDSFVPLRLLRHSFQTSERGPSAFVMKLKPWKGRKVHQSMIDTVERLWRFAASVKADHESVRILKLNYMRLLVSYNISRGNKEDSMFWEVISLADNFDEWLSMTVDIKQALEKSQDSPPAFIWQIDSLNVKFVRFCKQEAQTMRPEGTNSASWVVYLFLVHIVEFSDVESFSVMLKALDWLRRQASTSTGAFNALVSQVLLSHLQPLLLAINESGRKSLSHLCIYELCQTAARSSRKRVLAQMKTFARVLPAELHDRLLKHLILTVLSSRARELAP